MRLVPEKKIALENPLVHMLSAMSAGAMTNVVTQPLWLVRTRLMTQTKLGDERTYRSTLQALRLIRRKEGFLGLYKGLGTSFFGIFHVIIQFPLYERLKLIQSTYTYIMLTWRGNF